MCTQAHICVQRHIYTYMSPIYIHMQTHLHIHTYTYITTKANNPSPTWNMQLLAECLQLKLIFKSYQNAKSSGNIQRICYNILEYVTSNRLLGTNNQMIIIILTNLSTGQ